MNAIMEHGVNSCALPLCSSQSLTRVEQHGQIDASAACVRALAQNESWARGRRYSLETTSECSLFEIGADDLRAFLRKNPGVALSLFNHTYIE